jgi:hypothetical protein
LVAASIALLAAGCGSEGTPPQRPVSPREWKSVIRDSYDGRIDDPHRCVAVREAIDRIPHDMTYFGSPGSTSGILLSYADTIC